LAGVGVAFVMAGLSVRFIEQPIRRGPLKRLHIALLCLAMTVTCALGYMINRYDGIAQRGIMGADHAAHSGDIGHDEFHKDLINRFFTCVNPKVLADAGDWLGLKRCFQSKPSEHIDLLVLGDSHAEQLFPGLATQLPDLNVVFHGKGSLPLHDNPDYAVIFDSILRSPDHYTVLISAQWHARVNEIPKGQNLANKLSETITRIEASGKKVILVGDVYQFSFDPHRCKYLRPLSGHANCNEPRTLYENQQAKYMPEMKAVLEQNPGLQLITVDSAFCDDAKCSMLIQDEMAYRDNNHLNIAGSNAVARVILEQMHATKDYRH
jgi:hypothetical protein